MAELTRVGAFCRMTPALRLDLRRVPMGWGARQGRGLFAFYRDQIKERRSGV
jgi:hypothetical protein